MSLEIPEQLQNMPANCGIYAVWVVLQHCDIEVDLTDLVKICGYDEENGTFGIGLAVGLKKLGFHISFHSDEDLHMHENEVKAYQEASALGIEVQAALNYEQIQLAVQQGAWVIVYYDTLEGEGNHSIIYDLDDQEVQFFDTFEAMPVAIFEQQRAVEGICRQTIVIHKLDSVETQTPMYS